jgi:hypothetical protein
MQAYVQSTARLFSRAFSATCVGMAISQGPAAIRRSSPA